MLGKLICWIIRKRGGRHKYRNVLVGSPLRVDTLNPPLRAACVWCGKPKQARKPKQEIPNVSTAS